MTIPQAWRLRRRSRHREALRSGLSGRDVPNPLRHRRHARYGARESRPAPSDLVEDVRNLLIVPDLFGVASLWTQPRDLGGVLGLEIRQNLLYPVSRLLKRCIDLAIVVIATPLLVPVLGLIALAVKLSSAGRPFYGQTRMGRNGGTFRVWKFRTMVRNADEVLLRYLDQNPDLCEEWEQDHKLKNDPRLTPIGRILRKTSLDELPQFWNLLCGEMSLVGPRPIVDAETLKYGSTYDLYGRVPPGITGLWQVSGRNNTTYDERVAFDEYYVRNWSPWLDLYILVRTVRTVIAREGAY